MKKLLYIIVSLLCSITMAAQNSSFTVESPNTLLRSSDAMSRSNYSTNYESQPLTTFDDNYSMNVSPSTISVFTYRASKSANKNNGYHGKSLIGNTISPINSQVSTPTWGITISADNILRSSGNVSAISLHTNQPITTYSQPDEMENINTKLTKPGEDPIGFASIGDGIAVLLLLLVVYVIFIRIRAKDDSNETSPEV